MFRFTEQDVLELEKITKQLREDVVTMVYLAGSGHPGVRAPGRKAPM